jgi:hypothetical protein
MPRGRFNRVLLVLLTLSVAVNIALWRNEVARAMGTVSAVVGNDSDSAHARRPIEDGPLPIGAAAGLATLGSIEEEHLRDAREIADAFWSGGGDYQSAYADALAEGLASIRDELATRFGPGIKDNPEFRWLFRPLDPLYWFLSSDEQIAVQKLRLERDQALQVVAREASRPTAGAASAPALALDEAATGTIVRKYQEELAALLEPDILLELELRDSPIAQQLRASGVELSENEFRVAYSLMAALQRDNADPIDALAVRERLRGLLGPRRFAALWAARDPMFAEIAAIAERHSLPQATASSAYELLSEYQDRRLALASAAAGNPDRASRDAAALAEDERAALTQLVGEEVADEIVRGRARVSYRLFGSAGRPPDLSDSRESQGGRFR